MTSGFSDYVQSGVINLLMRSGSFAKSSNISIALCSDVPVQSQNGSTIPEIPDSNSYARLSLGSPDDTDWDFVTLNGPGGSGTSQNSNNLTFNKATGTGWGYISGIAIVDSLGHSSGNLIWFGTLDTPKIVSVNDQIQFDAGSIDLFLS